MEKGNLNVSDSSEMKTSSDKQLLQNFICGNQDAFKELMDRYDRRLIAYLRKYLGSKEDAEDVNQITWLNISENAKQFNFEKPFESWMYSVATNAAIDYQRNSRKQHNGKLRPKPRSLDSTNAGGNVATLIPDHELSAEERLIVAERDEILRLKVSLLPEPWRKVVEIVYYQNKK